MQCTSVVEGFHAAQIVPFLVFLMNFGVSGYAAAFSEGRLHHESHTNTKNNVCNKRLTQLAMLSIHYYYYSNSRTHSWRTYICFAKKGFWRKGDEQIMFRFPRNGDSFLFSKLHHLQKRTQFTEPTAVSNYQSSLSGIAPSSDRVVLAVRPRSPVNTLLVHCV